MIRSCRHYFAQKINQKIIIENVLFQCCEIEAGVTLCLCVIPSLFRQMDGVCSWAPTDLPNYLKQTGATPCTLFLLKYLSFSLTYWGRISISAPLSSHSVTREDSSNMKFSGKLLFVTRQFFLLLEKLLVLRSKCIHSRWRLCPTFGTVHVFEASNPPDQQTTLNVENGVTPNCKPLCVGTKYLQGLGGTYRRYLPSARRHSGDLLFLPLRSTHSTHGPYFYLCIPPSTPLSPFYQQQRLTNTLPRF